MTVMIQATSSKATTIDSGVPQGTVLGPLLFSCHINKLPQTVKSQVTLFADDYLLYKGDKRLKRGRHSLAIIDFSKAFDTVPYDRLLHKLNHYGTTDTLHNWLTSFLT